MQGAEERRLRRMEQYAASLPPRRRGEERALARLRREGNAAIRLCPSILLGAVSPSTFLGTLSLSKGLSNRSGP